MKRIVFGIMAVLMVTSVASAAWTVTAGNHDLQPNQAGQVIDIAISGDATQGCDLAVIIGDGGADLGGSDVAPVFTNADLLSGIFSGNNTGQNGGVALPLVVFATTTTSSGTVAGSGILAKLTIDTTGFASGSWSLNLSNEIVGSTVVGADSAGTTLVPGSITVIPEPVSILLLGLGSLLLRRRR